MNRLATLGARGGGHNLVKRFMDTIQGCVR